MTSGVTGDEHGTETNNTYTAGGGIDEDVRGDFRRRRPHETTSTMKTSSLSSHYSSSSLFVCGMTCEASYAPAALRRDLEAFVSRCAKLTCVATVVVRAEERGCVRRTAHINFERAKDCRDLLDKHRFDVPFGGRLEPAVFDRRALNDVPDIAAYQVRLCMTPGETESAAARRAFERVRSAGSIVSVTPWVEDRVVVVRFLEKRAAVSAARILRSPRPRPMLCWKQQPSSSCTAAVQAYLPDSGCVLRAVWRMSLPAVLFDRHQH